MTNEEAILILQDDLNHVKSHLQYIGKAPEYYEELSNLSEALELGIRAIAEEAEQERPQGKWLFNRCDNCGAYHKSVYRSFCPNCGADMRGEE